MILTRIISQASPARMISLSLAAYRPVLSASYTTASPASIPLSSSTDASKRQHRYLQTAIVHRPSNLLDAGAPPSRNVEPSLTGRDAAYPTLPPWPSKPVLILQPVPSKVPSATPNPQPLEADAKPTPTVARASRLRTPRKAAMTLTPSAVSQLRTLLDSPDPKLIRVGVKNRGCSGLAYSLEYVEEPGKFDEEVVQDGVRVLIDSKALFSIIGSEMDWVEDKLSARFVFKNPNISKSFPSVLIYITQHNKLIYFLQRSNAVVARASWLVIEIFLFCWNIAWVVRHEILLVVQIDCFLLFIPAWVMALGFIGEWRFCFISSS